MVKKSSKRFLHTGNTIRQYHRDPVLRQYQRYGCLVVGNGIEQKDLKATKVMRDITDTLPTRSNGVELSLNKRRRWELPSYIKHKVALEADSQDVKISVMEHRMGVPVCSRHVSEWKTCTSFYSNVGTVRECVSTTEMDIRSAVQGHREEDHLSKLERRQLKKMRRSEAYQEEDTFLETSLPSYDCHIVYGPRTDGRFYMELATTNSFARTAKKHTNHTGGCSKRFLNRHTYTDDDLSLYSDEDVYDRCDQEETITQTIPPVSLSDFIYPALQKKK